MTLKIPKWLLLCFAAFFLSTGAKLSQDLFEFSKNLEIFSAVYKEVGEKYVDDVPPGQLINTAIKSMLNSLDPYTVFFSEYQAEESLIERQGEYGGVGCRVASRNGKHIVTDIIKGYGFDKGGIALGDVLLKIDETNIENLQTDELMQFFRGAPNSTFQITVKRNNETLTKTITRSSVKSNDVPFAGFVNSEIGYIKLDEFGRNCSKTIENELKIMLNSGNLKGLILDLRDNGGGLLNEAVDIVGLFVGEDKLVVSLKGDGNQGPKNWKTTAPAIAANLPLIVLINDKSASASEVVSGSLQDLDRAVIIGQNSFGKGLVQNYSNLPYRTQMKITTARYYTPSGRCIQRLNYDKKDLNGKATIKTNDQKKSFKTLNGRTVFDGGGIDPDIKINKFQGLQFIEWMDKEFLLFDWANFYFNENQSQLSPVIVDTKSNELFENYKVYLLKKGPENLQIIWQRAMKNLGADSFWIKKQLIIPNNDKIQQEFNALLTKHKNEIIYELKKAILYRILIPKEYHKLMLTIDPEIQRCLTAFKNPKEMNLSNPK
jgi:carboxyl-terminal processing protease